MKERLIEGGKISEVMGRWGFRGTVAGISLSKKKDTSFSGTRVKKEKLRTDVELRYQGIRSGEKREFEACALYLPSKVGG